MKKRKIKKVVALLLSGIMMFHFTEFAFAQNTNANNDIVLQNIETIQSSQLKSDNKIMDDLFLEEAQCLGYFDEVSAISSDNSITQQFSGTIGNEGGILYLQIGLNLNNILHATLECPDDENLNYDLYLCKFNDEGYLKEILASSTLATYQNNEDGILKTMDESLSFINTESSYEVYFLLIQATEGCSDTEEFKITVSIDENGFYDRMEPNDSPYNATDLTAYTEVELSNLNLNVSNDIDWYCWKAPLTTGQIYFTTGNSDYGVKVYRVSSNGAMILEESYEGRYALVPDSYYYIRVSNTSTNFTSGSYDLGIQIVMENLSTKITLKFEGDSGDKKVSYNEGELDRYENWMKVGVFVKTTTGYPAINMPVIVQWVGESGNVVTFWAKTGSGSSTSVAGYMPEARGYRHAAAVISTHVYDLETITAFCGSGTQKMNVYHYKYSY